MFQLKEMQYIKRNFNLILTDLDRKSSWGIINGRLLSLIMVLQMKCVEDIMTNNLEIRQDIVYCILLYYRITLYYKTLNVKFRNNYIRREYRS